MAETASTPIMLEPASPPTPTVSNILLVEDEDAHAELMRRAFDGANRRFELTVASNLREARDALSQMQPDIIIADLLLPDGRGTELLPPEDEPAKCPLVVLTKLAKLEPEAADSLPAIEGAATQIRQIVMNLIMNASDALGGERGRITVRTGAIEADRAYLATAYLSEDLAEGSYVYVEVSDTGCGMDESTQTRLFDPFFTTKSSGRGLGMAAVKGIVRSLKGAIRLESELGVGTSFRILFPASDKPLPRPKPAAPPREEAPAAELGGAATILVVDDDVTIRTATTITLEGAGYLVVSAQDGREAIERFQQHRHEIAAILLDISMPELSGDEAYRELRQLGPEVPVIVSSGSGEEEAAELIPGLAGFIQKPYKAEALIAEVREILHG